jgi:chemotaxis protein methyltransferase CheR
MSGAPGVVEVERFRAAVVRRLGLQFDDGKLEFLAEVLQRRMSARRAGDYLSALEEASSADEIGALARELTVGETYFFRNNEQFRALVEAALPELMRDQQQPGILRFLSAGCASGEEAYSIAIVTQDAMRDASWGATIQGVDVNPAALERAKRARYSTWALRETSPGVREKWFRAEGRDWALIEAARAAVRFEQRNLAVEDGELWRPAAYDVIFCRNVMMYFAPDTMRAVVARLTHSLAPGGFLFLGHAETLRGLSDDFHLRHTHETFYYQRKPFGARGVASAAPDAAPAIAAPDPVASDAWVDAIRKASERVATLIPSPDARARMRPAAQQNWDRRETIDLLRRERFAEALDCVQRDPRPEPESDSDKLLIEATLLAHAGRIDAAEEACHRLLSIDELNAGAHYALALCREQAGDRAAAADHDRIAIYLDSGFAMPRLHLGLMARRAGDHDSARRELGRAQVLLKQEDASRLLLFGGGFKRNALMALCESALRACGEAS